MDEQEPIPSSNESNSSSLEEMYNAYEDLDFFFDEQDPIPSFDESDSSLIEEMSAYEDFFFLEDEDMSTEDTEPTCRICLSDSDPELLLSPCSCKGTMANVHPRCLEHWLEVRNSDTCELCYFQFDIVKVTKTFVQIFNESTTMKERFEIICIMALSLMCALMLMMYVYLVAGISQHIAKHAYRWDTREFFTHTVAAIAMIAIIAVYLVQTVQLILDWKKKHYTVRLLTAIQEEELNQRDTGLVIF